MGKGQAAMEFLMTYGWALLVVLVAIAVLAIMGVFTPRGAGEFCSMGPGFSCGDFKVQRLIRFGVNDDGRIEMMITNGQGKNINEFFVTIDPNTQRCAGVTGYVASAKLSDWHPLLSEWPTTDPVRSNFPPDSILPIKAPNIPNTGPGPGPIIPGHLGIDCSDNIANCCTVYTTLLNTPQPPPPTGQNPRYIFTLPCQDLNPSLPNVCVGPGGTNHPSRLTRPGSRFKADIYITYKFDDSTLFHKRKGSIMAVVEESP